jgi:hypothetical protein
MITEGSKDCRFLWRSAGRGSTNCGWKWNTMNLSWEVLSRIEEHPSYWSSPARMGREGWGRISTCTLRYD